METLKKLKVWWVPQVPMTSHFDVEVSSVAEGVKIMDVLAKYDAFQFDNNIKPDYSNAGGIIQLGDDGWEDWYDEETGEDTPEIYIENKGGLPMETWYRAQFERIDPVAELFGRIVCGKRLIRAETVALGIGPKCKAAKEKDEADFLELMDSWNREGDEDSYPCVKMSDINRLLEIIRRMEG
jgi:hypothetical protein